MFPRKAPERYDIPIFGYLAEFATVDELLDCVRRAIERDAAERSVALEVHEISERLATLSNRERQVLERVIRGNSNKEIAADLGVTPKTIEAHRAKVMSKMGATSLALLVRMCIRANV